MSTGSKPYTSKFILVGLLALFVMGIAERSGAQSGGAPPEDTTTWVFVSNTPKKDRNGNKVPSALGVQLHAAGAPDGRVVTPQLNRSTQADGHVGNPEEGCDCLHFHGRIGAREDPAPNECGWGCVVPFDELPLALGFVSSAITLERRAELKIDLGQDLEGAAQALREAQAEIDGALASEPGVGEGGWTKQNSKDFRKQLRDAKKLDGQAAEKAQEASDETRDKNRRRRLRGQAAAFLEEAMKLKQQTARKLIKKLRVH